MQLNKKISVPQDIDELTMNLIRRESRTVKQIGESPVKKIKKLQEESTNGTGIPNLEE